MQEFDEAQIRAALSRAQNVGAEYSSLRQANLAERSRILVNQRNYLDKLLASFLTNSGRDVDEFNKVRVQNQAEIRRVLQAQKSGAVKHSSSARDSARHAFVSRRETIEHLESLRREAFPTRSDFDVPERLSFNFVVLDTPLYIWPSQDINLVGLSIAPWNNVAKIKAEWETPYPDNGGDSLTFAFMWQNPSDAYAVINVESYLEINGFCDAMAGAGFSVSNLTVQPALSLAGFWSNPPATPPPQLSQFGPDVVDLHAYGGGLFGLGDFESTGVSGVYDVWYRLFLVPPKGVTVFGVNLGIYHETDNGFMEVDFASGDFEIVCPSVVIAVLS